MLFVYTVFCACVMKGDLIDDKGFELGLPSREKMLKHQCDLLCSELDVTRRDLRQAHKNIAGLIVMYRRESERETARMGYQYGDYSKREKP